VIAIPAESGVLDAVIGILAGVRDQVAARSVQPPP
jgi:hypothetical protein